MATTRPLQQGSSTVEFALVATLLLTLLFCVMELGRIFLVWNAAQEVTRRAARDAAVMGFGVTPLIQYDAVLQPGNTTGTSTFPGIGEITNWTVSIQFMTGVFGALTSISSPPVSGAVNQLNCAQGVGPCVTAVEAALCAPGTSPCQPLPYLPIGLFGTSLQLFLPLSTVTLPLESAGASSG